MGAVQPDAILIEDSPDDLEMFMYALRMERTPPRFRVIKDGKEALKLLIDGNGSSLQLARLKLILLDLNLPKIGGLEVLKRVKCEAATQHIPVVVLTTSDDSADVAAAYRLGANSYLTKPMDFDQFIERVAKIFDYWLHTNIPPPMGHS